MEVGSDRAWVPPADERAIGLGFYISRTEGVDGVLKSAPEDFRVDEISSYPLPDPRGPYTILRVESEGWEQHELASAIARTLHLPRREVRWAGTKDRRAVSERLFSYRGTLPPQGLDLPRVHLVDAYPAAEGLRLGSHYGNRFEIVLRELRAAPAVAEARYRDTLAHLRAAGGVPNFFGPQRFGQVRPITHEVGRALVRRSIDEAVQLYLGGVPDREARRPADAARRAYAVDHDAARALRDFPVEYRFERTLLAHLARGHSAERAFRALDRELRLLFVHAYQSLLFNRWLTERWGRGIGLSEVVEGDRILRRNRDGTLRGDEAVPVLADNRSECAALVAREQAIVAGPLVGFETTVPPGPSGEILRSVLDAEALDPKSFRLPAVPELASAGSYRPAFLPLPPVEVLLLPDPSTGGGAACFRFTLPRGSYATVVLREFTKSGASAA